MWCEEVFTPPHATLALFHVNSTKGNGTIKGCKALFPGNLSHQYKELKTMGETHVVAK